MRARLPGWLLELLDARAARMVEEVAEGMLEGFAGAPCEEVWAEGADLAGRCGGRLVRVGGGLVEAIRAALDLAPGHPGLREALKAARRLARAPG